MILIAHRGNLTGPNKESENMPDYINVAIQKGFYVEIDVWLINNKLFLGHDEPQYEINFDFIENSHMYCHAKNLDALEYMIKNKDKIICFSHNNDDYVITSNNKIWSYPGFTLSSNCICCMPEKKNQFPENCFGVCTDYPIKYGLLNKLNLSFQNIYDKMRHNNLQKIHNDGLIIDNKLKHNDDRKCFGISTMINTSELNTSFKNMMEQLNQEFNNQIIYDTSDINQGTSHFSFINIIAFDEFNENESYIDNNYDSYKTAFNDVFNKFNIYWKGLVALPTGICMIGVPDVDINNTRDIFRERLTSNNLKIYERYKTDIVHSTLLRLCYHVDKDKIISFCEKYKDVYFGCSNINNMNIMKGTWKANENYIITNVKE
jgi:hypothetical protein